MNWHRDPPVFHLAGTRGLVAVWCEPCRRTALVDTEEAALHFTLLHLPCPGRAGVAELADLEQKVVDGAAAFLAAQ